VSNTFKSFRGVVGRESDTIVNVINQQLKDLYSVDVVTGLPIFRVVWSEDQFEKRHGTFDDFLPGTQIYLRTVTETREVPKYRQWIHGRHILERLVVVPECNRAELPANKISYEPLWVFRKGDDNETPEGYLPPRLDACKFIIDSVLAAQATATMMITGEEKRDRPNLARYKDPAAGKTTEEIVAHKNKKIDGLVEELFGDESGLMGATLPGGNAIIVPQSFKE
jgi:hypothetical protein